ncbi:TonB-dependent receptor [Olivibacter ginsenosidimutans]|uniref:TonB-dependent receptor n=2 Tax=Olivibacter ginsenosidimutans TaxID=1176537 RepID=A0ABP9BPN1_9SPHI
MLVLFIAAKAQEASLITVKGQVVDQQGLPIIGASIVQKNVAGVGVSTNANGDFSLRVPGSATLTISYTGYKTVDYPLNNQQAVKITLEESTEQLDEIVIVGYGQQKKASVTGSVASIQSKELNTVKTPNVTNMLAGRLPGLRAVQRSGAPGDDGASVDIRGYGNMLVIVDGVQRDFAQINSNDIESISILKDAAAAVYGFKGANGVLLVTTKKGAESKPKIDYNGFAGIQKVTRYPKMMNAYEYASLYNEAILNVNPTATPAFTDEQLASYKNGGGTDWWNEMVRGTAPQMSHDVSVSGGNEKVSYFNSFGYLNQGGILRSGDWKFSRYNVRSNISMQVAKGFSVDLKLGGIFQDRNKPAEGDELFRQAQMAVPTFDVFANNNPDYWQAVGDKPNPVHTSYIDNAGYERRLRREFNSSVTLNWQLPWVEGLSAKAMLAYDYKNSEWKTWKKELSEYTYDAAADSYNEKVIRSLGSLESKMENYYMPTQQYSLNYNHTFGGKHDVGGMLLWEMYNDRKTSILGGRQYTIGLIDDIDYGDKVNQNTSGVSAETAHAGLVGRFNYAYAGKYLAELSFRYDGSYKFRSDNRWGFFPGLSLGWRISEENFFKESLPDFDNFKLRGSYAKVGDEGDFDAYQYLDGYNYSGGYVFGNQGLTLGLASRGMANPWLSWYESKIMNFGFETSYKNGLLTAEFDWFRRNRSGLPATRQGSLPTTFGQSMPQENLNSDINTGFELSLGHRGAVGEFKYNVSANFSTTRIKNDYVERTASTNQYDNWRNNSNDRYKDIRWGKKAIGQFTSYEDILNSPIQDNNGNKSLLPGDLKFEDVNHDGIIDDNDVQPIGHGSTPRMYYGLNIGAQFKGFDMTLFFQGAAGHDIYLSGDVLDPFIQQGLGNGFAFMMDRWHRADPTDPNSEWIPGTMPAARVSGFGDNRSNNTWSLHKADYLRLKTIEIGYTLPGKWLADKGIERLRVYLNCNNLLTFTNKDGLMQYIDPEADNSSLRYYPQMKTMNFGVNVSF